MSNILIVENQQNRELSQHIRELGYSPNSIDMAQLNELLLFNKFLDILVLDCDELSNDELCAFIKRSADYYPRLGLACSHDQLKEIQSFEISQDYVAIQKPLNEVNLKASMHWLEKWVSFRNAEKEEPSTQIQVPIVDSQQTDTSSQIKDVQKELDDLKKHYSELEEFAFATSKKLRVPLSNITGIIEFIDNKEPLNFSTIQHLMKSTHQINSLIQDLNTSFKEKKVVQGSTLNSTDEHLTTTEVNKVLLLDDDPTANMINERLVKKYDPNMSVKTFQNGNHAIDYLFEEFEDRPDLIILDLNMPILGGFDFLEEMEMMNLNIPVVMVTASIEMNDQDKAFSYPMVKGYMVKPLSMKKLYTIFDG